LGRRTDGRIPITKLALRILNLCQPDGTNLDDLAKMTVSPLIDFTAAYDSVNRKTIFLQMTGITGWKTKVLSRNQWRSRVQVVKTSVRL
jgi:hypothetical protein